MPIGVYTGLYGTSVYRASIDYNTRIIFSKLILTIAEIISGTLDRLTGP